MAHKKIGCWERDPITRQSIFFCTYCATCKDKIYLSKYQAQEFLDNTAIWLDKRNIWQIILKKLTYKLPKIRIVIERGGDCKPIERSHGIDRDLQRNIMEVYQ